MQRFVFLKRHHLHRCVDYYLWLERIAKEVEEQQAKQPKLNSRRLGAQL